MTHRFGFAVSHLASYNQRMHVRIILIIGAILVAGIDARAKSLHWSAIEVEAKLDSEGRLHVLETQTIVFDGDWNGGERIFRLGSGHELDVHGIRRIDPSTGTVIDLPKGNLDRKDHYELIDSRTLRWRSRLPSEPPFRHQEIRYAIRYTLSNILIPHDSGLFTLDHDFAFTDRDGVIERFALELELDPAWQPVRSAPLTVAAGPLPPGRGYSMTLFLRHTGSGWPAGVYRGTARPVRVFWIAIIGLGCLSAGALYVGREKKSGRFAPLTPTEQIDEAWLQEHLFRLLPEVAGAAWDEVTAAPEVAAVLARMVVEGKLQSEVERRGSIFSREILHLELRVPLDRLRGHEKTLIKALFREGATTTSTDEVRQRYKSSGFDPTAKIRGPVERAARLIGRRSGSAGARSEAVMGSLIAGFLLAAALMALAVFQSSRNLMPLMISTGALLILFLFASVAAFFFRSRVDRLVVPAAFLGVFLLGGAVGTAWLLISVTVLNGAAVASLAVLLLAVVFSTLEIAHARDTPERIEARKRLASARRFFLEELRRPEPRLRDEWFPYLLAFGLGPSVDRWFRAFGGVTPLLNAVPTSGTSFGSSSSRFTGGGGAFGGAGASGGWVAAATGMASGVSAPSSSGGSGGGGGGGGSSGGGGGGGW